MKKVYFSGKFNKLKDPKLSLSDSLKDDYRSKILGGSEKLTHPIDTQIVFGKYIYTGPFQAEIILQPIVILYLMLNLKQFQMLIFLFVFYRNIFLLARLLSWIGHCIKIKKLFYCIKKKNLPTQ